MSLYLCLRLCNCTKVTISTRILSSRIRTKITTSITDTQNVSVTKVVEQQQTLCGEHHIVTMKSKTTNKFESFDSLQNHFPNSMQHPHTKARHNLTKANQASRPIPPSPLSLNLLPPRPFPATIAYPFHRVGATQCTSQCVWCRIGTTQVDIEYSFRRVGATQVDIGYPFRRVGATQCTSQCAWCRVGTTQVDIEYPFRRVGATQCTSR